MYFLAWNALIAFIVAVPLTALSATKSCTPRFVADAEFGPRDLVTNTTCPGMAANEDQSCTLSDAGVTYGVSEGLIIHKEAVAETYAQAPGYTGKLPFGLAWGDSVATAAPRIKAATAGKPPFHSDRRDSTTVLFSEEYCLLTRSGGEYALELWFDDAKGLYKAEGRILYP